MAFFIVWRWIYLKTAIETLKFPCEFKRKLKIKVSFVNLNINYIDGHLIETKNNNLGITEPYKIITKDKLTTLIAYLYKDNDKIYLPASIAVMSFAKFTQILNEINKN